MTDLNIPANLVSIILNKQVSSKSTWVITISNEEKLLNYKLLDNSVAMINYYHFLYLCDKYIVDKGYGVNILENERGTGLVLSKGGLIQKNFSSENKEDCIIEATLWVIQNNKIKSNKKEIA